MVDFLSSNSFAGFINLSKSNFNHIDCLNIVNRYDQLLSSIFNKPKNYTLKIISKNCYIFADKKNQINSSKEINNRNYYFYYYGYLINSEKFFSSENIDNNILNLEGEFSGLLFNKKQNTINIFTDRFASRPLFYTYHQGLLYFSNNPYILAKWTNNSDYNLVGIFQLFKFGHTIGDITTFAQVKRLNPGSIIIIKNKDLQFKNYWSFNYNNKNYKKEDLLNSIFNSFILSNQKRLSISNKNISQIVSLSGGLDSRFIAYVNKMNNLEFLTMSLPGQINLETKVAIQVAKKIKLNHKVIEFKNDRKNLKQYLHFLMLLNGFQSPSHTVASNLPMYSFNRSDDQIIYGGWPGDVLLGSYVPLNYLYLYNKLRKYSLKNFINRRGLPDLLIKFLFKDSVSEEISKISSDIFMNSVEQSKSFTGAQTVSLWAMKYRQPSFSFNSPANLLSNILEVTPFLSYQYNELLQNLSAEDLYNKNFYKKIFKEKMKEMSEIIYSNTGKLIESDYSYPNKLSSLSTQYYNFLNYKYFKKNDQNKFFSENIFETKTILDLLSSTNIPFNFDNIIKLVKNYNESKNVNVYDQHIFGCIATILFSPKL